MGANLALEGDVREVFSSTGDNHFFGYYDKSPFDATGRYLLSHRFCGDSERVPAASDTVDIILWDIEAQESRILATTRTFNWQQGACLQWLGPDFQSRVVFNDHRNGEYVSVVLDVETGAERVLPMPVYTITGDGLWAACVNYGRLFWCRPGYNYACGGDSVMNAPIPEGDGISLMHVETGELKLVISTQQMAATNPLSSMLTGHNYLEHLLFSPSGERLFFMHRWRTSDGDYFTRVYVAQRDGAGIRLLSDSGDVSHYAWKDDRTVLLFGSEKAGVNALRKYKLLVNLVLRPFRPLFKLIVRPGGALEKHVLRSHYHLVDVDTCKKTSVASGQLTTDGHPSFRPGSSSCFVSDTYPDAENYRNLYIHEIENNTTTQLGRFASRLGSHESRCDLHPRWDRAGKHVCIDSTHTGTRQIHVLSLSGDCPEQLVGASERGPG